MDTIEWCAVAAIVGTWMVVTSLSFKREQIGVPIFGAGIAVIASAGIVALAWCVGAFQ